jgi:hypothetical protein
MGYASVSGVGTRGASAQAGAPRCPLGRWLVETVSGRETVTGYVAGWVARVDGRPVGFVRSHPRHARVDLLAFALSGNGAAESSA